MVNMPIYSCANLTANQCGFHDAIDLSDNVVAILKSMQNGKIAANENMQVVSDWLLP